MTKIFKLVGLQIIPKANTNSKTIQNIRGHINVSHCRVLFEKMLVPSQQNKPNLSGKVLGKTFNIVGIADVLQGEGEAIMNMKISSDDDGMSRKVMETLNGLVREVH